VKSKVKSGGKGERTFIINSCANPTFHPVQGKTLATLLSMQQWTQRKAEGLEWGIFSHER